MQAIICGRYRAELAGDISAALALRSAMFRGGAPDGDCFDALCDHIIVTEVATGVTAGCVRVLFMADGQGLEATYSAQFYDLARLRGFAEPMIEVGRFCLDPDHGDADVMRVIWGALTQIVDARGVKLLFGCTSFPLAQERGVAFDYLALNHLAPDWAMPAVKAADVVLLEAPEAAPDTMAALKMMPALLRSYLGLGAWVSDHAVVDPDLETVHVFTGLELDAIPEARKRRLRAISQTS